MANISPWRGNKLVTLMSTAFLWSTGCTAKEPGERSTTPKTERKEEGQSFTADYILKAANCE